MPFRDLSETRIHYEIDGPEAAPLLVLAPSLGADLTMWDPQISALASTFRILRYDTRGHGQSSVPPGPYSIAQLARDAIELIDQVGASEVNFCGISMSGMVGMYLALHHPQRLRKIVLSNTAARIGSDETWNPRIATVRQRGMEAISAATMERWFTPEFRAREPQTVARIERMVRSTPAEGYVACCAAIRDCDLRNHISDIRVPTLVIAGKHDAATTPADGKFLTENIRRAEYVEVPVSHLSNVEAASQFNSALRDFFA